MPELIGGKYEEGYGLRFEWAPDAGPPLQADSAPETEEELKPAKEDGLVPTRSGTGTRHSAKRGDRQRKPAEDEAEQPEEVYAQPRNKHDLPFCPRLDCRMNWLALGRILVASLV